MDAETQEKLDRLARIEQANRDRSKKYLKKIKAEGKKPISAIVSGEAFEELTRRRDESIQAGKPLSLGGVIEAALFQPSNIDIKPAVKDAIKDNGNIDVKKGINKTADIQEPNEVLLNLGEGTWKEKAKRLNDMSILTANGKPWTDNNLRMAVKKLKKTQN